MSLTIRIYGDPVLREQARPVESVTPALRAFAEEMLATMHEQEGVGLAAQQVGSTQALCVVEVPASYDQDDNGQRIHPDVEMPLVLINPELSDVSEKMDFREEGCLSFPGIRGDIPRHLELTVKYLGIDGQMHARRLKGFLARVVQHEVDHLNGVLFIDRMSAPKKLVLGTRLKRMRRETEERLVGGVSAQ